MDDQIRDEIIRWLKANAYGRNNAKPRRELRNHIYRKLYLEISDRKLRRIYATINFVGYSCSNPKGIYWITGAKELREFKHAQAGRAVAIFARTKRTELELEKTSQSSLF